jgi:hypothetical protein
MKSAFQAKCLNTNIYEGFHGSEYDIYRVVWDVAPCSRS